MFYENYFAVDYKHYIDFLANKKIMGILQFQRTYTRSTITNVQFPYERVRPEIILLMIFERRVAREGIVSL